METQNVMSEQGNINDSLYMSDVTGSEKSDYVKSITPETNILKAMI